MLKRNILLVRALRFVFAFGTIVEYEGMTMKLQ
jgi:hypothetical protein